jgi:hypothetical protein
MSLPPMIFSLECPICLAWYSPMSYELHEQTHRERDALARCLFYVKERERQAQIRLRDATNEAHLLAAQAMLFEVSQIHEAMTTIIRNYEASA